MTTSPYDLLARADKLLKDSTSGTHDPQLRRQWGQERKRLQNDIYEALATEPDQVETPELCQPRPVKRFFRIELTKYHRDWNDTAERLAKDIRAMIDEVALAEIIHSSGHVIRAFATYASEEQYEQLKAKALALVEETTPARFAADSGPEFGL